MRRATRARRGPDCNGGDGVRRAGCVRGALPVVVIAAGLAGWLLSRWLPAVRTLQVHGPSDDDPPPLISDDSLHVENPSPGRSARILTVGLPLWFVPVLVVVALLGTSGVYVDISRLFSITALVSFGGAYAV